MDSKPFRTTRRIANLRQGRNDWYRIKASASADGPSQLHIYDEIGFFGVTSADLIADLTGVKGDLEVHLNSPGGDLFEGIAIYSALKQRPDIVSVVIDSLAASAASVIAMAADPGHLIIGKNASMMIHDGFSMGIGNAKDLRDLADLLDKQSDNIASIYADRTGQPASQWRDAMQAETWYVGQEAVDAGLADFVQGSEPKDQQAAEKLAATWDLSIFARAPGQLKAAAGDMHGDHARVDPDNDGDCDACPEGDTDHDYFAADGTQIQALPGQEALTDRGAAPIRNAADESAWDASKAMANGAASDDPAAFYAGICAGEKAGDKSTQDAWALPYKYHPGDAPNAAGVRNALSRLPQTEGLTNKAEAQALLERLMKQVNPDYEPSENKAPSGFLSLSPDQIENIRAALEEAQWAPR